MANEYYVIKISPEEVKTAIREYLWGVNHKLHSKITLNKKGASLIVELNNPDIKTNKEVILIKHSKHNFMIPRIALIPPKI